MESVGLASFRVNPGWAWGLSGASLEGHVFPHQGSPPVHLPTFLHCKVEQPPGLGRSDTNFPTSQAPSSRRSRAQAWEASGSWNSPLLAAGPRVSCQSWQRAPAPGRGCPLSLPYHLFVPSTRHLSPVLWREGAWRRVARIVMVTVCGACILRRCTLAGGWAQYSYVCPTSCRLGNLSSDS